MIPLKLSVLGIRGVVGDALTPEMAANFAGAFGTYTEGGLICISRDTRPSGEMLRSAVLSGLIAAGCQVQDLGICPSPALQWWIQERGASGGIAISAGHNPEHWNALKFFGADGRMLNAFQGEELLDIYHSGDFRRASWEQLHRVTQTDEATGTHARAVAERVKAEAIRKAGLRVAVDCCNGALSSYVPGFLREALGCRVFPINADPTAGFPHTPEPSQRNMSQVKALVDATQADLGFCLDADGERVSVVTNTGEALSEEATVCLAALDRLDPSSGAEPSGPGTVVANVSTTLALDVIAREAGATCVRSRVGQPYLVEAMLENQAVLAGEGSGGVIWPDFHTAQDALMTMARLLEYLALTGSSCSALAARIPVFHQRKHSIPAPPERAYSILQGVREFAEDGADLEGAELDFTEGVRWVWPDATVHVRASLTEPIIRIHSEATDPDRADRLCARYMARLQALL